MDGLQTLSLSILQYAMCTYRVLFTPRTNSRSLALSSIRTIPLNDAECSFCFGGFLVRSYLGCLDCVEVNRVRGSWNLEAFR